MHARGRSECATLTARQWTPSAQAVTHRRQKWRGCIRLDLLALAAGALGARGKWGKFKGGPA